MESISLVFPHQLFEHNPCLHRHRKVILIEEHLLFRQYRFHKQKIHFHRASMKFYEEFLRGNGFEVDYIDSYNELSDIRKLIPHLAGIGVRNLHYVEVTDDWLDQRISQLASKSTIKCQRFDSPMFLNTSSELRRYFADKKGFFQTNFYRRQRKKWNVLLDGQNQPKGGRWSFDSENRRKFPKDKKAPDIEPPAENKFVRQAGKYVDEYFPENYGSMSAMIIYPATYEESRSWLEQFLSQRFCDFGTYQDAIVADRYFLNHSLLSPMLNTGLITPAEVLDRTLEYAEEHEIPINSLEGFIRQILGWREFIRAVYILKGNYERTRNFWGFSRKIPVTFWEGNTGIKPVDQTIRKVLDTGYAHHIERLMILGNFMLLCEFDPDEVYRWFMELFIDAYDWVMVPNVYGMSQFADGGLMSTKPYISSSNYLMKMSNFEKGDWQRIWDGLFWRFMNKHRDFFGKNPRLSMLIGNFDRMDEQKKRELLESGDSFLEKL